MYAINNNMIMDKDVKINAYIKIISVIYKYKIILYVLNK